MIVFKILALICAICSFVSCELAAPGTEVREVSLLPGECLRSSTLIFDESTHFSINDYGHPRGFVIAFDMDLDEEYQVLKRALGPIGFATNCRYKPKDLVFNGFGKMSSQMKKEYETLYTEYSKDILEPNTSLTTIYYQDKLSLTADKAFAGIPSGEDLSSIVLNPQIAYKYYYYPIPDIDVPTEYIPLPRRFAIVIPVADFQEVVEPVKMHLEIPVRIGMLLNYLNDKLSDDNATMTFRDEILTCDFTILKSLQP